MTDAELDAIEKACAEATPPGWAAFPSGILHGPKWVVSNVPEGEHGRIMSDADGEFIAGARSWVPALVAEVRRLRLLGGAKTVTVIPPAIPESEVTRALMGQIRELQEALNRYKSHEAKEVRRLREDLADAGRYCSQLGREVSMARAAALEEAAAVVKRALGAWANGTCDGDFDEAAEEIVTELQALKASKPGG